MATYTTDFSIGAVNGARFNQSSDLFSASDNDVFAFTFPTGGTLNIFLEDVWKPREEFGKGLG